MKRQMNKHLFSVASMLVGGAGVLGLVFVMNELNEPPKQENDKKQAAFKVEQKTPPKKPKAKPKRRRRAVKTSTSPPAPMPNLLSSLSGVNFDLPAFQATDFAGATEKLLGDTSKETVMTADTVDEKPKPRRRVAPPYPEKARQRGIEGHVTLKVKITTSGAVERVRVVDAEPKGVFEESAVDTVKQWQFAPAMYEGKPVEVWVDLPMRFTIS